MADSWLPRTLRLLTVLKYCKWCCVTSVDAETFISLLLLCWILWPFSCWFQCPLLLKTSVHHSSCDIKLSLTLPHLFPSFCCLYAPGCRRVRPLSWRHWTQQSKCSVLFVSLLNLASVVMLYFCDVCRWLQPESYIDPKQCVLQNIGDDLHCSWPVTLTVLTKDQYGNPVHAPKLKVWHEMYIGNSSYCNLSNLYLHCRRVLWRLKIIWLLC